MAHFDELIHQPVRLRLLAVLMTLDEETQVSFNALKTVLQITDGNLATHLSRLEEVGYIVVEKTFVKKKPQTYLAATSRGRTAFQEHLEALQELLHVRLSVESPGALRSFRLHPHAPGTSP